MRKILIALLALGMTVPIMGGMQVRRSVGMPTVAGTFDDILLFNTMEANDNTGEYNQTTGEYGVDTSATRGVSGACDALAPDNCISTASVKVGTYGYEILSTGAGTEYMRYDAVPPASEGSVGMWLRSVGGIQSNRIFVTAGGAGVMSMRLTNTGTIDCVYNDGTVETIASSAAASIAADTWYFIECDWDASTDLVRVHTRPDAGAKTTVSNTATAYAPGSGWNFYYFGNTNSVAENLWIDNVMLSNLASRDLDALRNDTASPR